VAGTPNFRTSFQMFIRCKMGLERRQSHKTMVTPFAETNQLNRATILSHNKSVGDQTCWWYCAFKANSFFVRFYDVMNVLMTKTCLTVPFVGVTDFTKPGAHPRGRGLLGCNAPNQGRTQGGEGYNAPNPPEPKFKNKHFVDTMI
jgi:hypothetical protein